MPPLKNNNIKKPQVGIRQTRTFSFEVREIDEENRTVHVSFSSEQPVNRFFGNEILCHDKESVDLSRLKSLGVSLFNHNRDVVIGIPQNPTIDEKEHRGHCDLLFDDDEESEKIFRKVKKGILRGISVGYQVDCWEEVKAGATSSNGRFKGPAYIATKWTPLEVSVVSVPADSDVGVNRDLNNIEMVQRTERDKNMDLEALCRELGLDYSALQGQGLNDEAIRAMCSAIQKRAEGCGDGKGKGKGKEKEKSDDVSDDETDDEENTKTKGKKSAETAVRAARDEELNRSLEITTICRDFNVDAIPYIKDGKSVDEVRSLVLNKIKNERQAVEGGSTNIIITGSEADKFRSAAVDGLLLRGQIPVEKPADGANNYRTMKLRDIAIECVSREGVQNAHRLSDEDLFKRAITPDSNFSSILSNSVNKTMATTYKAAATTYDAWCGKGSASDFKEAERYQLSEGGELKLVTQSGEIKNDEVKDSKATTKVLTYARSFGFTRQALINDDLNILTKIPMAYVRAALRGRNKLVYKLLGGNGKTYDSKNLFDNGHNNIGKAAELTTESLGILRKLMRKQKNIRGIETLNIAPAFLIVPAALEVKAAQLLASTSDPQASNSGVKNIFQNSMTLIVDAELDDYSETAYYVAANPSDIDTIEVTYLNGKEQPTLESQVGFDYLGIKWRIIDDFGVSAIDYRGLAMNAGA